MAETSLSLGKISKIPNSVRVVKSIMRRKVKRESEATGEGNGRRDVDESAKKEKQKNKGVDDSVPIDEPPTQDEEQGIYERRILRSQYLALIHKISGTYSLSLSCSLIDFACFVLKIRAFCFVFADSKDDLTRVDSDKFSRIFSEFENLHQKGKNTFYESEMFFGVIKFVVFSN